MKKNIKQGGGGKEKKEVLWLDSMAVLKLKSKGLNEREGKKERREGKKQSA